MCQARRFSTGTEHPAVDLHRWFIYARIENLSCGTDKLLLLSPLNIHSGLISRSCPQKCYILPIAVSGCFRSLPCLIWKQLQYCKISCWYACEIPDGARTGIRNIQLLTMTRSQVKELGSTPALTVLPIMVVAKLVVPKMAD